MITIIATPSLAFPLGQLVITSNAQSILTHEEVASGIARHAKKDWGNVPPEDASLNDEALIHGDRILSAYGEGEHRFWIITEADRSVTTVLMPEDY